MRLPFDCMNALVIDQESLLALDLARALDEAGCGSVMVSKSLERAMALLAPDAQVDVAILSLVVGEESALPLARRLIARGTRVILTSVAGVSGRRVRTVEGIALVEKPYLVADVLRMLQDGALETEA